MDNWYVAENVSMSDLRKALGDERLRWVYAERLQEAVLTCRKDILEGDIPLDHWTHARAFGPELELSWWRNQGHLEVRAILTEKEAPLPGPLSWQPYPTEGWDSVFDDQVWLSNNSAPQQSGNVPAWSTARISKYKCSLSNEQSPQFGVLQRLYFYEDLVIAYRLLEVFESKTP